MKRLATLVMAAAFVLGTVCSASAVDFKVKGVWDFAFGWGENVKPVFADSDNERQNDPFYSIMRIRPQIDIIASENLSGTLMFEIGDIHYGRAGGALDTDGVNIETKRAYLDWIVPGTNLSFRMGLQGLNLPSATGFNSPVFADDVAGVVANYKFNDTVALTGVWARPYDAYENDTEGRSLGFGDSLDDETDVFALILPITLDGFKITPWGAYAQIGGSSGFWGSSYHKGTGGPFPGDTEGWFAGLAFEMTALDPVTFAFDVIHGDVHGGGDNWNGYSNPGARGWFVDAKLDYKLDWGTPGIFGWWASGDDADDLADGRAGRMPTIGNDSGFAPTDFGFDSTEGMITSRRVVSSSGVGTWGVGVQLKNLSFVENLTHTIRVAYYQGTNDKEIAERNLNPKNYFSDYVYLTDDDSVIEVNFNHKYQIYENLAAFLQLGYMNLDRGDAWGDVDAEDAWKAQLAFQYKF